MRKLRHMEANPIVQVHMLLWPMQVWLHTPHPWARCSLFCPALHALQGLNDSLQYAVRRGFHITRKLHSTGNQELFISSRFIIIELEFETELREKLIFSKRWDGNWVFLTNKTDWLSLWYILSLHSCKCLVNHLKFLSSVLMTREELESYSVKLVKHEKFDNSDTFNALF